MKKRPSSSDETKRSGSSVGEIEIDPFEDTSWVVVKKQRVTILLPPLSVSEGCSEQHLGTTGALDGAAEVGTHAGNGHPQGVDPSYPSLREVAMSEKIVELLTLRIDRAVKPSSPFRKICQSAALCTSGSRVVQLDHEDAPGEPMMPFGNTQVLTHIPPNKTEVSRDVDEYLSPGSNRMITARSTRRNFSLRGMCVLPDGPELLNRQLRARSLKRKLEDAGGLVSWLLSMGLDQFVKIFEHKPVNEFQLASLTMPKLKEMGAAAIGPRRKLMHALNCMSHPCPAASEHTAINL